MTFILLIIFFSFGLIIGSFLNVIIFRLNTGKSLGGRSACMSCRNTLSWYELVPLMSYLALWGRCKNCQTKISWQYPLVELLTGLTFAILFWKLFALAGQEILFVSGSTFAITYFYYALMSSILIVITAYDIKHKVIPDMLALLLAVLAFGGLFLFQDFVFSLHLPTVLEMLTGVLISLPFALLWLVSRGRWMGLGDAKLLVGLGWVLGLSRVLSALALAFWGGAIIGICLVLVYKKYALKSEIPFAPYLVLGTLLAFLFDLHLFF